MNGLKLIRTICNYSQTKLAEALHVSRQAINMWENGRKGIPEERRQQLCDFFGITDASWLDEVDAETKERICAQPMYRAKEEFEDTRSVHYFFSPEKSRYGNWGSRFHYSENVISIDEQCLLKRDEVKTLVNRIQDYAYDAEKENSMTTILRINRTLWPINALLDAMDVGDKQSAAMKMPYYYTVMAVLYALNIAFQTISEAELLAVADERFGSEKDPLYREQYDYSPLAIKLSKEIAEHLAHITSLFAEFEKKDRPKKNDDA